MGPACISHQTSAMTRTVAHLTCGSIAPRPHAKGPPRVRSHGLGAAPRPVWRRVHTIRIKGEIIMTTSTIAHPKIVSRDEWLVARQELL